MIPIQEQGALNLYRFVSNDPLNRLDPNGWVEMRPGINCIGYACGYDPGTEGNRACYPSDDESIDDLMKNMGWNCSRVDSVSDCECKCDEDRNIVYPIRRGNGGDHDGNFDPITDPFWGGVAGNYDPHAFRCSTGCGEGDWSCVPQHYPNDPQRGAGRIGMPPEDYNNMRYGDRWKDYKPLCCCKKKE